VQENTLLRGQLSVNEKRLGLLQGYNLDGLSTDELGDLITSLMSAVDRIRITTTLRRLKCTSSPERTATPADPRLSSGALQSPSQRDGGEVGRVGADRSMSTSLAAPLQTPSGSSSATTEAMDEACGSPALVAASGRLPGEPRWPPPTDAGGPVVRAAEPPSRSASDADSEAESQGPRHKYLPVWGPTRWSGWPGAKARGPLSVFTSGDVSRRGGPSVAVVTAALWAGPRSVNGLLPAGKGAADVFEGPLESATSVDMDRELSADEDPVFV
jgi:hypothetical protein